MLYTNAGTFLRPKTNRIPVHTIILMSLDGIVLNAIRKTPNIV
jgi:hypothetical protein